MRWHMQRYVGRPTTNIRFEEEQLARADTWRRARRRNANQGQHAMTFHKPIPAPVPVHELRGIYRAPACTVTIIELPLAALYRRVFGVLQTRCPDGVPVNRWEQCVRDSARFLAKWGLEAEWLGWSSSDLYKLPPIPADARPSFNRMSRLDQQGLCWVLLGRKVTRLTADMAEISNPATGSVTRFNRRQVTATGGRDEVRNSNSERSPMSRVRRRTSLDGFGAAHAAIVQAT
jgi:hypothetical protein